MNQVSRAKDTGRVRRPFGAHQDGNDETDSERVARLHGTDGGPLVGWLVDEARRRGMPMRDMAAAVGVTVGYISQLRTGTRPVENISRDFARSCAEFLGVAPVVVMVVSGSIRLTDFYLANMREAEMLDRTLQAALADPRLRVAFPDDLLSLPSDAKRALVLMYSALSGQDLTGFSQLPESVRWLRRAAALHADNVLDASAVPEGREVVTHREHQQL